ncbi:MAG: hypothetical protein INH41_05540, partial [Myxococcaceae bacterium]|nr:hypothetical protein [Myxococcaceae bacterium]
MISRLQENVMKRLALVCGVVAVLVGCVPIPPVPCTECGGACVDLQNDRRHCGACGTECSAGSVCTAGACVAVGATCAAPLAACTGGCFDLKNDPAHFGTCTTVCGATEFCRAGQCTDRSSDAGAVSCPMGSQLCSGVCFDLQNDPGHCGSCTRVCATSEYCRAGNCTSLMSDAGAPACPSGTSGCDGGCFDQQNDPRNCGACGRRCLATEYCAGGGCTPFPSRGLDAGTCVASTNPCEVVVFMGGSCVTTTRSCPPGGACRSAGTCNPTT